MKTILLTMVICVLTAAVSYGQGVDALEVGSQAAAAFMKEYLDRMRGPPKDPYEERRRQEELESGRALFGDDGRWGKEEWAGTLASKGPLDFKIGDWGCTSFAFKVLSKVSNTECLVGTSSAYAAVVGAVVRRTKGQPGRLER